MSELTEVAVTTAPTRVSFSKPARETAHRCHPPPASRLAWDRLMLAHRRYTSANGDALAGSVTYALLVCSAPAVLLMTSVLHAIGVDAAEVGRALRRSGGLLMPGEVVGAVDRLPSAGLALNLSLLVALVWTTIRLVRAIRTAVRAMCGQDAGSGNPVRDAVLDALLGVLLLSALTVLVAGTAAAGGRLWGVSLGILSVWLLFAGIILRGSWPQPGRPRPAAALRASFVAAIIVELLTLGAHRYFTATAALHSEIYQAAAGLVGVLVWCSLACRTLLRATAWASTARRETDGGQ